MFDIGFLEIIVILVITLLVIGPERMPEVARKIGQFVGKTRRFINSVKDNSEISETVRELQDSINLEEEKRSLEEVTGSLQEDLSQIEQQFEVDEAISRPFGQDDATPAIGSQFNKAPAQPKRPEPPAVTEQEPQSDLAADPEKETRPANEASTPTATDKPVS